LVWRSTTQLRAQANMAFPTVCMAGFVDSFLALRQTKEHLVSTSPGSSHQGGFDLGTGSNLMLTLISGWARRARVQLVVPGVGWGTSVNCRWKACSLLCLCVGKGLVWRKSKQAGKCKEKNLVCLRHYRPSGCKTDTVITVFFFFLGCNVTRQVCKG